MGDVPLGTQQTENFKFKVFNNVNTTFKCNVTKSDVFSVPATLTAEAVKSWDGEEMTLAVNFEPTEIGKVNDVLTITSEEDVEYICELSATCNPPLPQGPFAFSKGSSVDIPFRNCFPARFIVISYQSSHCVSGTNGGGIRYYRIRTA